MKNKLQIGDEVEILWRPEIYSGQIAIIVGERKYDEGYWIKLKSGLSFTDLHPSIRGENQGDYIWGFPEESLQLLKKTKRIIKPYGIVKFLEGIK